LSISPSPVAAGLATMTDPSHGEYTR
jgi:hypothetical protein